MAATPTTSPARTSTTRNIPAARAPKAAGRLCNPDCGDGDVGVNGPAFADYEGTEIVDFAAARAWWGRPLLRAPQMPAGTNTESVLVRSDDGRRSDPRATGSGVAVVYLDHTRADVRENTYFGIIGTGAFAVEVLGYSQRFTAPHDQDVVTVRGKPGWYFDIYDNPPEGNVNYHTVSWLEPRADGGSDKWQVASDPTLYTKDQLIAFANSLTEA